MRVLEKKSCARELGLSSREFGRLGPRRLRCTFHSASHLIGSLVLPVPFVSFSQVKVPLQMKRLVALFRRRQSTRST